MSKFVNAITKWQIILSIQLLASILLFVFVYQLNALPPLYLGVLIAVLVLFMIIMFFFMKPSIKENKGKVREVLGKITSIILSIVLVIGSLYITQGDSLLENITGADEKTNLFSLIVLNTSEYTSSDDLSFKNVGMSKAYDSEEHYLEAHHALIYDNPNIRIKEYDDYMEMIRDFYAGNIDAICVNEAYHTVIEEVYETFLEDIKVIWSHEIIEQIVDISKVVNVTNSVFTVYISGIDTTGKVSTVSRSDVNMLVTVNPITKDILLTSIPRDYYVTLDNKGKEDKLTHAGLGGVENSVKTIENFMGIDINYYARVNFTSVIKIVDALGGITVNSPVAFTTRKGGYYIKKGENKMDGDKALCFVRERYALGGGDGDRVKNQQRVLTAMLKKAMSPAIITNFSDVLEAIDGSFETNMSSDEIMNLIQMQLTDMAEWNIHSTVLSGHGKSMTGGAYIPNVKLYYLIPDQESIDYCAGLIKQMMDGEKITVEEKTEE